MTLKNFEFPMIFKHDIKNKISRLWKALKFKQFLGMTLYLKYHIFEKR